MPIDPLIEKLESRWLLSGDGLPLPLVSFQVAEQQLVEAGQTVASAAADLNGDDILDLIVASRDPHQISFHLGTADGRYHLHASAPLRAAATDLALADLNHDGDVDVLVAAGTRSVVVGNLGASGGQWNGLDAPRHFVNRATSVQLADLNGDGLPDLVGGTERTVEVRLGKGDGNFEDSILYHQHKGEQLVTIADVDQDHDLDVIAATNNQRVAILLNQGDGIFEVGPTWQLKAPANAVLGSDVSGDGLVDVIVGSNQQEGDNVWVFRGSGSGEFLTTPDSYETTGAPLAFAVADVNLDRVDDLVVAHDGTFHHPVAGNGPGGIAFLGGTESGNLQEAIRIIARETADIQVTQDGTIFGVNTWNSTLVKLRPAEHEIQAVVDYSPEAVTTVVETVFGDFNGDGQLDAAVADAFLSGGTLRTYLGQADGSFRQVAESPLEFRLERLFVVRADVNLGDDLLLVGRDNRSQPMVSSWLSTREGGFRDARESRQNTGSLTVADLNRDGLDDYVVFDLAGTVSRAHVYLAAGDGTFARVGEPIRLQALWDFRLVDVNGDHHPDLFGRSGQALEVAHGQGDGTFAAAVVTEIDNGAYGLGDVDGDGDLDAVVANYNGSRSTLRIGESSQTGGFQFGEAVPLDDVVHSVYVTPFPGSAAEILVGIDDGLLVVGLETGSAVVRNHIQLGFPPSRFLASEIDGDSLPELVVGLGGLFINSSPSTSLGFLDVDARGRVTGPATSTTAPVIDGMLAKTHDLNGDGSDDFLVTHRHGFTTWLTAPTTGDYDGDGSLGPGDIDLLRIAMQHTDPGPDERAKFDLTQDGSIDDLDLDYWLVELADTVRGDVNLDGSVAFNDFLTVAQNFAQHVSSWGEGDLDGDGLVGFADFLQISLTFGSGGPPPRR